MGEVIFAGVLPVSGAASTPLALRGRGMGGNRLRPPWKSPGIRTPQEHFPADT